MSCQNPERCAHQAASWKAQQERYVEIGEKVLAELRESLERGESNLRISYHGDTRQTDRCISGATIRMLVCDEAWPFWYYKNSYGIEKLELVGHVKAGEKKYRPIHVILIKNPGSDLWKVTTVYDPRSKEYKWGNNYQERKCFCK